MMKYSALALIAGAALIVACSATNNQNTSPITPEPLPSGAPSTTATQAKPPIELALSAEPERIAMPVRSALAKTLTDTNAAQGLPQSAEQIAPGRHSVTLSTLPVAIDGSWPLDQNEQYALVPASSIKQTRTDPVSTFATDVDTASYSNSRRFLQQGQLPPVEAIRVEEFINYFDYQLPNPAAPGAPIGISTELMATPWNAHTQLLRVALQAQRTERNDLPPLNLVFLLDVSGSMHSADKLPLMQSSFNLLVQQLRPEDHVAIVVYAGASGVVLEPTSGQHQAQILAAIHSLTAGGSTHGSAGIELAYELASQHFQPDAINRVLLATDGDFNVGTQDTAALVRLIEQKRALGVFLSVLGFGRGNYNDAMMEELSNHGNGTAYYIDSFQEARKIFAEQLTATLQTVAQDVKIQIEFNPEQIAEYRLLGYDNRALEREDFNNDKIDAGEMGAGHSVTALYEIVPSASGFRFSDPLRYQAATQPRDSDQTELAFVKVRYKLPGAQHSELLSVPITAGQQNRPSDAMQLSSAVAGFAEMLRASPYLGDLNFALIAEMIGPTLAQDRWGYRQDLLQLVRNANALSIKH